MNRRTFALLLAAGAVAASAQDFYLKNGDRVVFYGDSITDQRLYTTFTETYVLTRFPKLNISFVHSGWGGDRVSGGGGGPIDVRLKRDVLAYKPTVVTIMLGMNDGGYRSFDQPTYDAYVTGYRHIVQSLQKAVPAVRLTLIEPSPFDDVTRDPTVEGGYNTVLVRYGQFVRALAKSEAQDSADLNGPVVAALAKANALDPETARKLIPDRVHPGPAGHLLMAKALLQAWHAPGVVTSVEIDAAHHNVVRSDNTNVNDLEDAGGRLSWTQLDKALPMPLDLKDPEFALAIRASDFLAAIDSQPLLVTGLRGERYTLKVGGTAVGSFTRDQLETGVNLATLATPMAVQAAAVHALTLEHNDVHFARWREVQVPLQAIQARTKQPALDALDRLEAELIVQQHAAAQPKSVRYELAPE